MTLGGNVCVRNGNSLDYCWQLTVKSLLPVCDEVVICDGESTDGTQEEIREWIKQEPKIKVCVYSWPNPVGDIEFWVKWLNFCREHIKSDYQIQLDADEVLSENSYEFIRSFKLKNHKPKPVSLWCRRYNFWSDARHLIPTGVCLSDRVVRIAPQNVWLPSDGPHPNGAKAIGMALSSPIEIFHYGFLRGREEYFKKSRALHGYFFGKYDERLVSAEEAGGNWMNQIKGLEWTDRLVDYAGSHPKIAREWLTQRGQL